MVVVIVAFLVPVLLHRFNLRFLPVVVAEIIVGLIIGKSGLNIVTEDMYLTLLSSLGFIYLMFLSGLELDFTLLSSSGKGKGAAKQGMNVVKIGLVICVLVMALSVVLAYGLQGLGLITEPFLFTIVIATISLGVVVPVLKEQRLTETKLGQGILFITVVLDFVTMILLAFFISMRSQSMQNMLQLLLFFVFAFLIYRLLSRIPNRKLSEAIRSGTIQIGTRAVFALILLFVVLSETLGVEMILGAFLAGVIVSLLMGPNKQFVHKLETFGYGFLIPIFFVMIGADLELRALLGDPAILVLLPALLLCFYISKMLPSLLIKRWYPWKETLGAGVLLSANLSLVVAAAEVAYKFEIISAEMRGALILVAVISCFVSPILFSRIFPKVKPKPLSIGIVGANHITLPVSLDLMKEGYNVALFSADTKAEDAANSRYPLQEIEQITPETLAAAGLFHKDVVVLGTAEDEVNVRLAQEAKDAGVKRIIVRVEEPDQMDEKKLEGMQQMSTLYASRTLMKAVIEHPSAVQLLTQNDDSIQEVEINNTAYDNVLLRNLDFLGDVLIMRIFRGDSFLVPHGNTELKLGDRLLISGELEGIERVKQELG